MVKKKVKSFLNLLPILSTQKYKLLQIHSNLHAHILCFQVSKNRSSIMNSLCFGEYQATAFAEPRRCKAYSTANTGSFKFKYHSFFTSTLNPVSILKLKGPAICIQEENISTIYTSYQQIQIYFIWQILLCTMQIKFNFKC